MKRFAFRIGFALLTFAIGMAAVWLVHRHPVKEKPNVIHTENNLGFLMPNTNIATEPAGTNSRPQKSKYLNAIEIISHDKQYPISAMRLENTATQDITIDLDLGDNIENQIIRLDTYQPRDFKIEQQFETSITIMDEGPHVDLSEWRHYRSQWKKIGRIKQNEFLTSKISEKDYSNFPYTTPEEIYKAVLEKVKAYEARNKEWGRLMAESARTCKSPTDYPCGVGVSKISFRIKVKENGLWKIINQINFIIPMGC